MCSEQKGHWLKNAWTPMVVWSRDPQIHQSTTAKRKEGLLKVRNQSDRGTEHFCDI